MPEVAHDRRKPGLLTRNAEFAKGRHDAGELTETNHGLGGDVPDFSSPLSPAVPFARRFIPDVDKVGVGTIINWRLFRHTLLPPGCEAEPVSAAVGE